MRRIAQYSGSRRTCTSWIFATGMIFATPLWGCHDPDPRTVVGALDAAVRAVEAGDARRLFRLIDRRARAAMASIVADRREAAGLIASDYPAADRAAALASLGGVEQAVDAAGLFALRCTEACLRDFGSKLGAPVREIPQGPSELQVHTAPGAVLQLHRGRDGWWGLVWNTEALSHERDTAARELLQVKANAEVYRRRRALEQGAAP